MGTLSLIQLSRRICRNTRAERHVFNSLRYSENRVRDAQGLVGQRPTGAQRSPQQPDGKGRLAGIRLRGNLSAFAGTPVQAFQMALPLAKLAPEIRKEREMAAQLEKFENDRSAHMWQQAGQLALNGTAGVLNNIATTLYALPMPAIAQTTNAMAGIAYTNAYQNYRNWRSASNNEFSSYPSEGAPAGAQPSIGAAIAGNMPQDWQIARGLAQGIDSLPMVTGTGAVPLSTQALYGMNATIGASTNIAAYMGSTEQPTWSGATTAGAIGTLSAVVATPISGVGSMVNRTLKGGFVGWGTDLLTQLYETGGSLSSYNTGRGSLAFGVGAFSSGLSTGIQTGLTRVNRFQGASAFPTLSPFRINMIGDFSGNILATTPAYLLGTANWK